MRSSGPTWLSAPSDLQQRLRHLRVVLSKRFSRFKFDYREEWLRLIDNLSSTDSPLPLSERAVMALAEIIESPGGMLFVQEQDHSVYVPAASWSARGALSIPWQELRRDALIEDMESRAWIVDSDEVPQADRDAFYLQRLAPYFDINSLTVPLLLQDKLFGFVVLQKKRRGYRLTYEDIDLLRTSGRQVASYLAQHYVSQRLAQAEQFETYGRMTAFLIHDLKNIIAQQSLVIQNAERHKHKPNFIDDAINTIELSVSRMNRVLKQLRLGTGRAETTHTDLAEVVADAVERCRAFAPSPELEIDQTTRPINVLADSERLVFGFTHLIRNAQQAASPTGRVRVGVRRDEGGALAEVADNGPGMSDSFVHQRLFRPFDSSSPEIGMGIGAYQLRETVRAIGGTVTVQSTEGRGSLFQIRLPLSEPERAPATG
jgi:putative PEP-CTERM system histidine kinase